MFAILVIIKKTRDSNVQYILLQNRKLVQIDSQSIGYGFYVEIYLEKNDSIGSEHESQQHR